jgi:uncharacterized phiE125 gp8 family phage protein
MNLKIITAPTTEPISLTEAKLHLRVTSDVDNTIITNLIKVARRHAEKILWKALASTTFELVMDKFPCGEIELPMPPVESVESIKYTNSDEDEVEWDDDNYIFYNSEPAIIIPAYGLSYPTFTPYPIGAVKIRYIAGYKTGSTDPNLLIPEEYRQAMLLLIGHLYEHREEVAEEVLKNIPAGVQSLLFPDRIWSF